MIIIIVFNINSKNINHILFNGFCNTKNVTYIYILKSEFYIKVMITYKIIILDLN